jgi:CRP-like cAMP-binding protein
MVTNREAKKINIQNYIDAILSLNLFSSFPKNELLHLFSTSKYKVNKYEKGQIVHLQNEICNTMDIVLEGRISVQKITNDGNILKITVFTGGDILGANLLFSSRNSYPMTVVSESKSTILHIYKDLILKLSQKDSAFTSGLLKVVSDKTVALTDKINSISLKTVRQRILDFLRYEYYLQKSNVLQLDISKKELSERFGIQRTSLSRELNKMRKDGLLEFDSRTITINSPDIFA